jgi:hypothetical protein
MIKKFKKISKVNVITTTRPLDSIAYLFCVTQPTKNSKIEKVIDKIPINNKLYSISQIASDGAQTIFTQNK